MPQDLLHNNQVFKKKEYLKTKKSTDYNLRSKHD